MRRDRGVFDYRGFHIERWCDCLAPDVEFQYVEIWDMRSDDGVKVFDGGPYRSQVEAVEAAMSWIDRRDNSEHRDTREHPWSH